MYISKNVFLDEIHNITLYRPTTSTNRYKKEDVQNHTPKLDLVVLYIYYRVCKKYRNLWGPNDPNLEKNAHNS